VKKGRKSESDQKDDLRKGDGREKRKWCVTLYVGVLPRRWSLDKRVGDLGNDAACLKGPTVKKQRLKKEKIKGKNSASQNTP